ncbi:MAG: DNA/RNA non-specific endonuclease [Bacteroidales bacterium]|nr:DNA/RNA non-specific endonuclease [Bacteroidales bacterium]
MKTFRWLSLVVVISGVLAIVFIRPAKTSFSLADFSFLPDFDSSSIVNHKYYSLSYNEESEQPDWVAYTILPERLESLVDRPGYFRVDTLVLSGSANQKDYAKSGYDRGHLVPAADMQFDSLAIRETFFYSNISPQLPGFNRGVWKRLEEYTRKRSVEYDSLIVISGPVIRPSAESIGENEVLIPASFYKLLIQFYGNNVSVTSYLIPHTSSKSDLSEFIVSVDSIEVLTGLDFLYNLPDKLENKLERR